MSAIIAGPVSRFFFLALAALFVFPAAMLGDTMQFPVNPAETGALLNSPVALSSNGLNGTVLEGQSLSLDLLFGNDVLGRLFLSDPGAFGLDLTLYTNAASYCGFAGATTGNLLDPNGNPFGSVQQAGRAESTDGSFVMGLVEFNAANLPGSAVDISGVHFDTVLPNTGYTVTGAELVFSFSEPIDGMEFGTAQQLPEPPTFELAGAGALLLAGIIVSRSMRPRS